MSGVFAAGCLALNARWRRPLVSYLGLALVLAATLWGLEWGWPVLGLLAGTLEARQLAEHLGRWPPVFAAEVLGMGGLALLLSRSHRGETHLHFLARPLARTAEWVA